jgi:hypothetical protein
VGVALASLRLAPCAAPKIADDESCGNSSSRWMSESEPLMTSFGISTPPGLGPSASSDRRGSGRRDFGRDRQKENAVGYEKRVRRIRRRRTTSTSVLRHPVLYHPVFRHERRLLHRKDHEGKSLAYVYFKNESGRRSAAHPFSPGTGEAAGKVGPVFQSPCCFSDRSIS